MKPAPLTCCKKGHAPNWGNSGRAWASDDLLAQRGVEIHEIGGRTYRFEDTWEWRCQEYTGRFVWCCYALAWSIKKYDCLKAEEA